MNGFAYVFICFSCELLSFMVLVLSWFLQDKREVQTLVICITFQMFWNLQFVCVCCIIAEGNCEFYF